MHPFRTAVEAHDHDAIPALLAEEVTFLSPVAFSPYEGRDLVAAILRGADRVFEGFHYVREIAADRDLALVFEAEVGGRWVQGCDLLRLDDHGLIEQLTVMVRPLSAAHALSAAMAEQFEVVKDELGLGS